MNVQALVRRAIDEGIVLQVKEGRLKFEAMRDKLSDELRALLVAHREALITYLRDLPSDEDDLTARLSSGPRKRPPGSPPAPASHAQERLWFIDRLEGGSTQYNMQNAYRVEGPLDKRAVKQALNEIVERHEVLRSRLAMEGGELRQFVSPWHEIDIRVVDLSELAQSDRMAALDRALREDASHVFDLGGDILLRLCIYELSDIRSVISFNMHHVVSDGLSLAVLISEFSHLYAAHAAGEPSGLSPLPIQYGDFASWQRDWLRQGVLEKQLAFWRRYLHQLPLLHSLPLDLSRPQKQTFRGKSHSAVIDSRLTSRIGAACRRFGTTPFMLMETALAVLIARYGGETDVVIGTPIAGRLHSEVEPLIGLFVNTLAIRTHVDLDAGFDAVLAKNCRSILDAFEHQAVPFESVVEALKPARSMAHSPLFQITFNMQSTSGRHFSLPGVALEPIVSANTIAKFELEIDAVEVDGQIRFSWTYNPDLFNADTIVSMAISFETLLSALLDEPTRKVGELPLLNDETRTLLVRTWNATQSPYPADGLLHRLFEEQSTRSPDAIALVVGENGLSYARLNAHANRLAHYLVERGVRPDQRVAICTDRSFALVIGLLAILKSGGAYVPLDPAYPSSRLASVLVDADPVIVLTDAAGRAALGHEALEGRNVVDVDRLQAPWANHSDVNPDASTQGLTAGHLAYVIYTSGSTGKPKGVMVEHGSIVNFLMAMVSKLGVSPSDRLLAITSISFDIAGLDLYVPLSVGAQVVLGGSGERMDPYAMQQVLAAQRITFLQATPSAWRSLLDSGWTGSPELNMLCGGEAIPPRLASRLRKQGRSLWNLYGPTETTVYSSASEIFVDNDASAVSQSIGRPIANTQLYLLDGYGQPVPLGAVGELYIGGVGVARGYLNRPDLTAERFLADPFAGDPDARMYRTGDVARYLPDGNLVFLGRNDHQVKLRGFRIELGEIESSLSGHPSVRDAVVLALDGEVGKRLVAYVVPFELPDEASAHESSRAREDLVSSLRARLSSTLPDYMVPSAIVVIDALPLTPNGKLDRRALPDPGDHAFVRGVYEAPCGEIETTLAGIWQDLLKIERVGRHDHFFELGGHSLLVVRLMERLRPLGLGTDIRALFTAPVLADFARTLGSHRDVEVPPNLLAPDTSAITPDKLPLIDLNQADIDRIVAHVPGGVANIQDIYALSPLQEGILFHHLLASQGDPYLLVVKTSFADRALLDRYLAAVQRIVDRHDILRTAFLWDDLSTPAQVVLRQATLSVTEITLDPAQGPVSDQLSERYDPRHHRMDLSGAPLLQLVVAYDHARDRWLALHLLHHLVGDHSTLDVVYNEVITILTGRGDQLAAPHPFRNLVAQTRLGIGQTEHEAFFRSQLADIDEPTLPFGLAEIHRDGSAVVESHRMLPTDLYDRLRAHARRLGVSLASLCHLAWGQVIAKTAGRQTVAFGTVLFGRMQAGDGADRAMGLFINTLPLRLDLDETPLEDSVRRTHARLADLLAHEHAPLALAQRCSGVAAPSPLFSALLNYRHNSAMGEGLGEDAAALLAQVEWLGAEERNNYPVTLSVEDFGHALGLTAQIVEPLSAERVCAYMQQALESLVDALDTAPRRPVRQLEVLPDAERRLLLETWNRTDAAFPAERCLHQVFEDQVRLAPDAPALALGGDTLTYAQLNARANRLAHHLIDLGVRPDDRVALAVERSFAMVVALLAILKAGGAYVPLDPAYPSTRLAHVLADADPVLVLGDAAGRAALGEDALAGRTVLDLDLDHASPPWHLHPDTDPAPPGLTSRHLAYVIYTSGSTGTPKGVMVEHRQLLNYFAWALPVYYTDPAANGSPATLSFAFDGSVTVLFGPLLAGQTLALLPAGHEFDTLGNDRRDPPYAALKLTPTHLRMLSPLLDHAAGPAPATTLILGGEMLHPDDLTVWHRQYPQVHLINEYGPTETTIGCTIHRATPADTDLGPVAIGRPIANTRIYLLDGHGQPVPLGAVGELYIGGAGVARGYLNRPDLTAERFLADPFAGDPDARMYRTGDLARYRPDGNLVFLGRNDHQVKLRGFRIELGEIEARLGEHPGVRQCAVLALGEGIDKRLVAYVVAAEPDAVPDAAVLRDHLAACLPDYMVPAAFVGLEALPLSPNGKLERSALPVPGEHREGFQATHVSARNDLERRLCEIWQNVLGQPDVGIEDNFFDMGGNSLQIMRAIFQARKRGLVLSAAQFFQYPTVSSLASAIVGASPPASGNDHDASAAEGHHAMCASDEVTLVEFEAGADMTEMHFRHLLKRLHGHHPQLSTMRGKGISDRDILRSMSWRNEHDPDDETMATASLEMRKRVASSGRTPFLAALAYDDDLKIVLAVHPDIVGMPDWNSILKTIATYCATGYRIGYHMKNQRDNEHV